MAASYDQYNYSAYWEGREYEHLSEVIALKAFLEKIPKINSILEVGSGFGRLVPYYSYRAKKIVLSDPSSKLLAESRVGLKTQKKIKFVHSKLENLPQKLKSQKFDLVIMVRVLHHLTDLCDTFTNISKLTSSGGFLILEFANKIHWKEIIKNFAKGDFTFPLDIFTQDKRSKKSLRQNLIPFQNFHPDTVKEMLKANKYKILSVRSVSNVRTPLLKKHLSQSFLLWLEKILQDLLSPIHFGPSVFILARKLPS